MIALVVDGLMNKQIAAKLGVTEITVKVHRVNMMRKMKARSVIDLLGMAIFFTAFPDEKVRTRALAAGAICYLTKPVHGDGLIRCLQTTRKAHDGGTGS